MTRSKIQWTDMVWNPTVGCTRISAGCDSCYAIGQAARGMSPQHRGLTKIRSASADRPGPDWTGEVRLVPEMLARPLSWRKPRRVFVDSMSDLFHAGVPFEYIADVFGVMAATPQHTYLLLTKRPERAREFFAWIDVERGTAARAQLLVWSMANRLVKMPTSGPDVAWPLRNVHLGVSAEDQATAEKRIPVLLDLPAAIRWVSYEPALGAADFRPWLPERAELGFVGPELRAKRFTEGPVMLRRGARLDWIVVGGESGPHAREFDIRWARRAVEQCRAAGVPVFVKQLGARPYDGHLGSRGAIHLDDRKGGDMGEWKLHGLEDLCVREYPPSETP